MKQAAIAIRPGSLLGYKGRTWEVTANDTLVRRIVIRTLDAPKESKAFHYAPGQELDLRWRPDTRV